MGDPRVPSDGEEVHQCVVQVVEDAASPGRTTADPRAEVVRRAPTTEDEPVVGGALAVDDRVPVVAERRVGGAICSHVSAGSGSVAMISEYTGTIRRRSPSGAGVALGRTNHVLGGARSVRVTTRPGSITAVAGVRS